MNILETASKLARTIYTDEFCSNCGGAIAIDAEKSLKPAENGDITVTIHKDCLLKTTAKKTLTYQLKKV